MAGEVGLPGGLIRGGGGGGLAEYPLVGESGVEVVHGQVGRQNLLRDETWRDSFPSQLAERA